MIEGYVVALFFELDVTGKLHYNTVHTVQYSTFGVSRNVYRSVQGIPFNVTFITRLLHCSCFK